MKELINRQIDGKISNDNVEECNSSYKATILKGAPKGLAVFEQYGNLVLKQITHDVVTQHTLDKKLFLTFVLHLPLRNENLDALFLEKFSELGDVYRMEDGLMSYKSIVVAKDFIIRYESGESTVKIAHIYLALHVQTLQQRDILILKLKELFKDHIVTDINVNVSFFYLTKHGLKNLGFDMIYTPELPEVNYPYISIDKNVKDMNEYIEKYIKSESPIIILMGEPGTGKTRFIRYLLSKLKCHYNADWNVYFTVDPEVLKDTVFFVNFMASTSRAMVVEDMDKNLHARIEGNEVMYSLLGISDGIINIEEKKMIFSTNLPSIKNIDSAIIREGRCYDILNFRALTVNESNAFLAYNKKGDLDLVKDSYTLAELYALINGNPNNSHIRKTGFKNE